MNLHRYFERIFFFVLFLLFYFLASFSGPDFVQLSLAWKGPLPRRAAGQRLWQGWKTAGYKAASELQVAFTNLRKIK
jgi:hypothetical protein